ncbi:acyl carrier protein [Spirillospora sp. NPDC050679]
MTQAHDGTTGLEQQVRTLVRRTGALPGGLDGMPADADLWSAGLDSQGMIRIMVAIEDEFAVELPDVLLTRRTFRSLDSISAAVRTLLPAGGA